MGKHRAALSVLLQTPKQPAGAEKPNHPSQVPGWSTVLVESFAPASAI